MNYKKELYNKTSDKPKVLSALKMEGYDTFMKELKKLNNHPAVRIIVEGNLFPNKISDLHKQSKLYYSENFGGELAWIVWSIKKYYKKINEYVILKEDFDRSILLSEYDQAGEILKEIENNICYSYWSTECKFSLSELKYGTEFNWELLNSLSDEAKNNHIVLFHLGFFSKKAESKVSFNRYKRGLEYDLSNLDDELKEYLYFKFGYFFVEEFTFYDFFLITGANNSIIDRYELVINLLTDLLTNVNHSEYNLALQIVKELNDIIDDYRLKRLLEFSGVLHLNEFNDVIIDYLEDYTKGNYEKCLLEFQGIIKQNPICIELFEPYIKSLIELGREFVPTGESSYIDDILKNLYSLYQYDNDFEFSTDNLEKRIIAFSGLDSHRQLLGLVSSMVLIKSKRNKVTDLIFFNSKFSNPILFLLNKQRAKDFDYTFSSLPYRVNYQKAKGKYNTAEFIGRIPDKKSKLYCIRSMYLAENFDETLDMSVDFTKCYELNVSDKSDIFNLSFISLVIKNNINEAIQLLTNQYLNNKNLCAKINKEELLNILHNDINSIPGTLEAVIFSHFASSGSYFQFVNLDELFIEMGIDYPHQLLSFIEESNKEKIIYILEKVCNVDVLGNFLVFESKTEVIKEREVILMALLDMLPEKQDEYIGEIAKLKRIEIIKNVIKEVNDGRIYINVNSLDRSQKASFQNNFDRLLSLVEYTTINDLTFFDFNERIDKVYEELLNVGDLKKDAAFLSCKAFVNELTNNFLYSEEYGLEGCLSTRIRHGALENVIRSVFERLGLISKKIGDNYQNIDFWTSDGNHLGEEQHLKIQTSFKNFSKKVDDLIKFLLNEKVQIYSIKSTDKKQALFNYYFSDDIHWLIYNDLKENAFSYDEFINSIFDILKTYTTNLLASSRIYFKKEVKDKLVSFIEELNSNILEALGKDSYTRITNNINISITEIQNEIEDNVSEWFKLSEDTYQNILDFESIINTSVSLTNNNNINFDPKISCNMQIGMYGYLHFIFIFRILFDNIIKHSKLPPSEVDSTVSVYLDEVKSILKISVINKFDKKINVSDLGEKFSKIKDEWMTKPPSQLGTNNEGGSGYEKIKRILNYDIKSTNSKFDYNINDNYLEIIIFIPTGTLIN